MKTNINRNTETLGQIFSVDDNKFNPTFTSNRTHLGEYEHQKHLLDKVEHVTKSLKCTIVVPPNYVDDGLELEFFRDNLDEIKAVLNDLGINTNNVNKNSVDKQRVKGVEIIVSVKEESILTQEEITYSDIAKLKSRFSEMLQKAINDNKLKTNSLRRNNMIKSAWLIDKRGNRITDEQAADIVRRNRSEIEDLENRMNSRSKADNLRDGSWLRWHDLKTANDYYESILKHIEHVEGRKIMNNKNITSSGRWVVKTNEDQMDYIGNFFEGLPSCPQYVDWGYDEEKYAKAVNDDIFGWMYEDSDFSEADKKKITRNFLKLYKDYYNNGEPKDDLNTYYFEGEGPKDPRLIKWLHSVLSDKELDVPFTTWHYVESSKKNIKSSKEEELEMFSEESKYGNRREFEDFKRRHPESTITYLDWRKYLNGYEDDVAYEYEDENGNMYTWDMLKKDIDDWVKNGDFKEYVDDALPDYIEPDGTPKYEKIYDDFWDIGSNGVMEYIGSSRRNNMKIQSSASLSEGERDGISIVLGYITKAYGEEEDFAKYDVVRNSLSDEELKQLDDLLFYVIDDKQDYRTINKRILKNDIPLLNKVYNILDDNDLLEDWDAMSGFEKICLTSSKGEKKMKVIKSASGSWEYQEYDMDKVEKKIGKLKISFTEPLLLADDGTLYSRAGFDQWLKYLEKEEGDNWPDAYELYHRDTDEEFIEMCQDDFFQHDFGYTLTIYPEGLKSIAESIAEEVPSNEPPFSIPSGFAFNLYPEEEEPSGFNSYWVDDMSLDSESFIWGINPKFGNRFDVAIDPDYLWDGTENIQSSKKGEKKMKIQSKRLIKSGTSNFVSNDGDFPLVVYIAENYVYDEETDSDTEERDYDADQWEYDDAIANAQSLAEQMDISLSDAGYRRGLNGGDDYSSPYNIGITSGYYDGVQIQIEDNGSFDPEYIVRDDYDYSHDDSFDDLPQEEQDRMISEKEDELVKEQTDKINAYLDKLCSDYGWIKLGVSARFSNGETWYEKIDNSRKSIKSAKTVADVEEELLIDLHDIRPVFEENGYTLEDARNFERMTWEEALPTIKSIPELAEMFEINSSRRPVTSGLTFRQAVQDFKAAGQWNDYYEMQQDWEAYKDGLERDGVISEKTRSTWGNPCTPEGFKKWNK